MPSVPVIFEDENIVVLDKPSGMVVHPFDFSHEETITDFLQKYSPGMFSIENSITLQDGRTIALGGIVHKLDRDTSGILIVAKNQTAFDDLQQQFKNHTIDKKYTALVEEIVEQDSFVIDAPLGRSKKDYKQSTNPINPRSPLLPATTEVHVLKRNKDTTLVELSPLTGRTHQLRAHMASVGHPIVGDIAYGSVQPSERVMLHASSLSCIIDGMKQTFTSPPEHGR